MKDVNKLVVALLRELDTIPRMRRRCDESIPPRPDRRRTCVADR